MSYTVRYEGSRQSRRMSALKDAHGWLNEKQWITLVQAIRDIREESGIRTAIHIGRFLASFAGIQGAPVEALIMFALRPKGHWMKAF